MKKQTAVEWLIYELKKGKWIESRIYTKPNCLFDKAMRMEKEQIIDARNNCYVWPEYDSEEYYQQTYGNDESINNNF